MIVYYMKLAVNNCIFDLAPIDNECQIDCRDLDRVKKFRVYIFVVVKHVTYIDVINI